VPKHRIELQLPVNAIVNADARFVVFSDDEKLGELRVSRGTIDWWPARRRNAIAMSWERFARVMEDAAALM
jgi:hypothetical protein